MNASVCLAGVSHSATMFVYSPEMETNFADQTIGRWG